MTTSRRMRGRHDPVDHVDLEWFPVSLKRVLDTYCERMPFGFRDASINATAFGFTEFELTVIGRDQWKVDARIGQVFRELKVWTRGQLALIAVTPFEPHGHPNRAARWKGKKSDGAD